MSFVIQDLAQAERLLGTLSGEAQGQASNHRVHSELQGPLFVANTALQGTYQDNHWAGVVSKLDLGLPQLGPEPWQLQGSTLLGAGAGSAEVRGLCLARDGASVCADVEYAQAEGASANGVIRDFPLRSLDPLLGDAAGLTGLASGRGELHIGDRGRLTGKGAITVKAGGVDWTTSAGMPVKLDVPSLRIAWQADQGQLGGSVQADLGENDFTRAELVLQRGAGAAESWPARGSLSIHLGALARFGQIVPELEDLAGSLDSDLKLAGTLAEPLVSGTASLAGFTTFVPELGTQISDVALDVAGTQQRTELEAKALVGGGQARLKGMLGWAEGQARASFLLSGNNLKLVERPDIMLVASPEVSLDLQGRSLQVTGRVVVPAADIKPVDISGAVRTSPDTMLVDTNGEVLDNGALRITSDVTVELGDAVHFTGYGLTTDLRGSLRVRDRPEQITTGRGELKVQNGHYKLYGMELQIERGQVLYADGPIDNPGLSIRAVREKDEVRVGADVGGTLREPTLSFFSTPAMPQSEIIAYLITGKPMASLDTASEQKVSAIGDALALAGGNLLSGEIGARVGLDELALRTTEQTGGSELVLGKYLSPKLFVSYGIGLYESLNSLRVRYQINNRLSVRTESGLYESVDIFWSQER
jgi:translocation and assembly module TamB